MWKEWQRTLRGLSSCVFYSLQSYSLQSYRYSHIDTVIQSYSVQSYSSVIQFTVICRVHKLSISVKDRRHGTKQQNRSFCLQHARTRTHHTHTHTRTHTHTDYCVIIAISYYTQSHKVHISIPCALRAAA